MPNNPEADEIIMQRQLRAYTQRGGPRPDAPVRYGGVNEQFIMFGDVTNAQRGSFTPVWWVDPLARDRYQLIAQQISPPEIPKATISFARRRGGISWIVGDLSCPVNFYEQALGCGVAGDFLYGWSDFLTIYSKGLAGARSSKSRSTRVDDNPLMDDVEFSFSAIYDIGGLSFREVAEAAVEREVVDVAFAPGVACSSCGTPSDGTTRLYALTASSGSGSPGTPAEVVWTVDGTTFNNVNITGLSGTVTPTGIDIVGNFVVVIDTVNNGYWYSEINRWTGAPTSWAFVSAGFVGGRPPTDIFVAGPNEVYFSARGGYVYRSRNIPFGVTPIHSGSATTANLTRIDGFGSTLVAVGESGTILRSMDRGSTWTTTFSPTSGTLTAVQVLDQFLYWIGSGTGGVWWTGQGGQSWNLLTLPSIQAVDDILFATDEVGYLLARAPNLTTARLWTTFNGGADWSASNIEGNPRILNFPTFSRGTRLAAPRGVPEVTAANYLAVGGLSAVGVDGRLYIGSANVI
jgi:hypothetical protein